MYKVHIDLELNLTTSNGEREDPAAPIIWKIIANARKLGDYLRGRPGLARYIDCVPARV